MSATESQCQRPGAFRIMPQITSEEAVLAIIPDETQEHRMVFIAKSGAHAMPIVLRQESYSPGVGWFTQSQIEMTRQQMVMLRATLGTCSDSQSRLQGQRNRVRTGAQVQFSDSDHAPAVLPFSPGRGRERLGA